MPSKFTTELFLSVKLNLIGPDIVPVPEIAGNTMLPFTTPRCAPEPVALPVTVVEMNPFWLGLPSVVVRIVPPPKPNPVALLASAPWYVSEFATATVAASCAFPFCDGSSTITFSTGEFVIRGSKSPTPARMSGATFVPSGCPSARLMISLLPSFFITTVSGPIMLDTTMPATILSVAL
ncbi:MAG: hypothetical protein E6J72_11985 [Deltaproteobacteria bacterium]|nr:MAG: hypothetical protein E6J72_11985 [Deltaproteobacteria bacterium]